MIANPKPKTLIWDIETTTIVTHNYSMFESNAMHIHRDWYVLSVSWKWLGQKKVHVKTLIDFPNFKKDITDDSALVKLAHELHEEADIIIAHNGVRFDTKKMNARFAFYDLPPVPVYKQIDTLQAAKKSFKFTSNRLDYLAKHLGYEGKMETPKSLWLRCEEGEEKAFKIMAQYNKKDVEILEFVYLKLRPWMTNHPHMGTMEGRPDFCEVCGGAQMHQHTKKTYAKRGWKYQYKCYNCGHYQLGTKLHKFENFLE